MSFVSATSIVVMPGEDELDDRSRGTRRCDNKCDKNLFGVILVAFNILTSPRVIA